MKQDFCYNKLLLSLAALFIIFIVFHAQSPLYLSYPNLSSNAFRPLWNDVGKASMSNLSTTDKVRLRASVTFLPMKDLRFAENALEGHTWFMSSVNDTAEDGEPEYMYFPSAASHGRVLCYRGRYRDDGTKNEYGFAWKDSLPESAILLDGLTFVSYTFYNHVNLWHGICAAVPFVRWSMRNGCARPSRWVLFHQAGFRFEMGAWLSQLMKVYFGNSEVERFDEGDRRPYCFEKALVVRHDTGSISLENRWKVYDSLRCKTRNFCGIKRRTQNANEKGAPVISMTLLDRRATRSFKNQTAVSEIFAKECAKVEGCVFNVVQSEDLSFCDQVRVMSETNIVASPHGAQLTNMFFMNRNSTVMEFFPKGWKEYGGNGQYCLHWLAHQTGMKHPGAWWDTIGEGEDCPNPKDRLPCFLHHFKNGKVGHNETYFAEWTGKVLTEMRQSKIREAADSQYLAHQEKLNSDSCVC